MRTSDQNSNNTGMRIHIGGAPVDSISLSSLLPYLDELVEGGNPHYVCFCEAHLCVRATFENGMRRILEEASLVLPDGVSMTLSARLLGKKLPGRLPGPMVMLEYCRHGVKNGLKHFFYGGDSVAEQLAKNLKQQLPKINIVGIYTPPFRPLTLEEERVIKSRIEESEADVLWVGLGAPKQERWMADHVGKINVPLMLGVGAAFDFHSGERKRAPMWVRRAGLEWVHRICSNRKIFKRGLIVVPLFMFIIIRQLASTVFSKNK